jgi:hypothetical protein
MSLAQEIIIVSGLPRSGTSLMMQMLDRAGLPILTDQLRQADPDNPRGYYEFEAVKQTKQHPGWVAGARGKVVKMISALLYDLPATERYRVLFMRRDLQEILDSQEKMLTRLGQPVAPREKMQAAYQIHLDRLFRWLATQPHFHVLEVNYNQLLRTPEQVTAEISAFLDHVPQPEPMVAAIDPELYRNRQGVRTG